MPFASVSSGSTGTQVLDNYGEVSLPPSLVVNIYPEHACKVGARASAYPVSLRQRSLLQQWSPGGCPVYYDNAQGVTVYFSKAMGFRTPNPVTFTAPNIPSQISATYQPTDPVISARLPGIGSHCYTARKVAGISDWQVIGPGDVPSVNFTPVPLYASCYVPPYPEPEWLEVRVGDLLYVNNADLVIYDGASDTVVHLLAESTLAGEWSPLVVRRNPNSNGLPVFVRLPVLLQVSNFQAGAYAHHLASGATTPRIFAANGMSAANVAGDPVYWQNGDRLVVYKCDVLVRLPGGFRTYNNAGSSAAAVYVYNEETRAFARI